MKKQNFKNMIAAASLVLGLSGVGSAHADVIGGALGAAVGAPATDVYAMTCPIGTARLQARVNDATVNGIQVSVQLINPRGIATTASAPDGGVSPTLTLAGGAGNYLVTVHKNASGAQGYGVFMECFNAAGIPRIGNQAVLVQDQ